MRKRVREEDNVVVEEGEEGGGAPDKTNRFDRWLIRRVYGYATVRDSMELARIKKEYRNLRDRFDDLLRYMREKEWGLFDEHFCTTCGEIGLREGRLGCGECDSAFLPCSVCGPAVCGSKKHEMCIGCASLHYDCDGRDPENCTFPD
jgi:hypothetical protein